MNWLKLVNKCKNILINPPLTFEFQTSTLKILLYNYFIVIMIANQDVDWNYPFRDSDMAKRLGHELLEPMVLSKFGFTFRLLTIVMNTLAVPTLLEPKREKRYFLMPCILWNFYTIAAVVENNLEIMWCMFQLEVPFKHFGTIVIVAIFMLAFHTKLLVQIIRFYEFLNYKYVCK